MTLALTLLLRFGVFAVLGVIILLVLPDASLPSEFTDSLVSGVPMFKAFNFFLPVDTMITVVTLIMGLEITWVLWKLYRFVASYFSGQGAD